MEKVKRIISLGMAIVIVLSLSIASMAATTIEDTYRVAGSYSVSTMTTTGIDNDTLYIYYPTNMTGDHPIITWGNGTWTNPTDYTQILTHLASYGFVIVCSWDSNQGTGELMKNAADWMIAEDSNPNSIFYNQLDTDKVAALGHSQGACGAVNVATSASYIDTVIPVSLVRPSTLTDILGVNCDVTQITCPTFLISGDSETWVMAPPDVTRSYYWDMVNNNPNQPVLMGILANSMHEAIKDDGAPEPDDLKGYITAWLLYQLNGDSYAAGAFTGPNSEIETNSNWYEVMKNNIQ